MNRACQNGPIEGLTGRMKTTQKSARFRDLHIALLEIVGVMNHPQRDEATIREAGISLDRALFPLLAQIERFGPLGVVELADRLGRDHTTVSRQITKLEQLGLIKRKVDAKDRRIRQAVVTSKGKAMTKRIDAARERIGRRIFETWPEKDIAEFARLMRLFADSMDA